MQKQLATFVEGIRQSGLLGPEQVDQIVAWADAPDADAQVIARDIVHRGWLTAFQVKLFWKGRGKEIFLNQYVLIERLGEGGMGEVYRAKHRRMDRDVALKIIRKDRLSSPDAVKRFLREITAAAHLTHENVVMAYDADQCGDRHFFAMEYVDGTNLARLVKEKGPLPVLQACNCIRQAALGLQHAFERNMVHRDIKPSNLLLSKTGVVKILDMGLARVHEGEGAPGESRITQEGLVIGTPDYLAPEQARNARTADIRADIYALGCTFYYLLTGAPPFKGDTPTEKLLRHTTEPVPTIARPDVAPAVEAIVQKMMAKRPEDRFQTPAEVVFALQSFSGVAPPVTSSLRVTAPVDPLASAKYAPVQPPALPEPDDDSKTDSQFQLPPPKPRRRPLPERTRWNLLIAMAAGVVALILAGGGIYLLVRKNPAATTSNPGAALDKEFKNKFDMNFALISTGSFEMGSTEAEDEGPVHAVEISKPFYMGMTEVTLRQYKAVMKDKLPREFKGNEEDLDAPVTAVTFFEARQFCNELNKDPGRKEGWEYRLPTEAEWEYACRAGTKSRFHTGDDVTAEQALFGDGSLKSPGKVGQFAANAWGLFDMHGNAAEWVNDKYDEKYYANSPANDPFNNNTRLARNVIRGGSFNDPKEDCRSARRRAAYGDNFKSFVNVGFRVVVVQVSKKD